MSYFNGSLHGYNGPTGFIPPVPVTKVYCDNCAEYEIPLNGKPGPKGQRHFDTDFRWCPVFGDKCHSCGEQC